MHLIDELEAQGRMIDVRMPGASADSTMDSLKLFKVSGITENENEKVGFVEYWTAHPADPDAVCVHRSAHTHLKKVPGIFSDKGDLG